MVLNRQWECSFSKGSPSLIISLFYLLDGPLAGMPVTVTDWKRCLSVFLNGKTWKLHFTSISDLWMPPTPPRMKLFGNQQLECLQGHMFFSRQKHTYISWTLQVTIKKVVYRIIFIVLATFQGIWKFWVYECTCLRISHDFLCTLQVWVLLLAFPIR